VAGSLRSHQNHCNESAAVTQLTNWNVMSSPPQADGIQSQLLLTALARKGVRMKSFH
jgi:hypothetical protein